MSEKFLDLSKFIFNKKKNNGEVIELKTPLLIQKNDVNIYVIFHIRLNLKIDTCEFRLESKNVFNRNGLNLILYEEASIFENLEKVNLKNNNDDNIRYLSIIIKKCYDMIDNMTFNLSYAKFVDNDDDEFIFTNLEKLSFNDKNKKYFDGSHECVVCYENVFTKTVCNHYLCYFCTIKSKNKCPLCRKCLDLTLKNAYYSYDYNKDESEDDD